MALNYLICKGALPIAGYASSTPNFAVHISAVVIVDLQNLKGLLRFRLPMLLDFLHVIVFDKIDQVCAGLLPYMHVVQIASEFNFTFAKKVNLLDQ